MSWQLRLDFLGLAGLVPLGDGRWIAALPDLKKGDDPDDELPWDIAPHQALVVVPTQHVHAVTSPNLLPRLQTRANGEELNLYELSRHHVRLPGSGDDVLVVEGQDVEDEDAEIHDLSAVPRMADVVPEAASFRGSLLTEWYGERIAPSVKLAATVLLDRGKLGARDVFREGSGVSEYVFRRPDDPAEVSPKGPLADGFRLAVAIEEETATLIFGDKDGNELELVVKPSDASGVTIRVHNEELEDVLGFYTDPVDPRLGDVDFAIFYVLSTAWNQLKGQQLPIPYRKSDGGGGKNKPCRGSQYGGVSY